MLWSKVVVPQKNILCRKNILFYFRVKNFLFFNGYCIFRRAIAAMNRVNMIQSIWQIFLFKACCYFKGAFAAIYLGSTIIFPESTYSDMVFSKNMPFWKIFDLNRSNETTWKSRISSQYRKK